MRMIQSDAAWTLCLPGGAILCRLCHSPMALNIVGILGIWRSICHPCLTDLMKGLSVSVSQIQPDHKPAGGTQTVTSGGEFPPLLAHWVIVIILDWKIIERWVKEILELNADAWGECGWSDTIRASCYHSFLNTVILVALLCLTSQTCFTYFVYIFSPIFLHLWNNLVNALLNVKHNDFKHLYYTSCHLKLLQSTLRKLHLFPSIRIKYEAIQPSQQIALHFYKLTSAGKTQQTLSFSFFLSISLPPSLTLGST